MIKEGISVIICCYNSAERLPETLKYLALQQIPPDTSWEIIVVDNASVDDTMKVAREQWNTYTVPYVNFKTLEELRPGKNHALETGIINAAYELILICDDDNWLRDDYIDRALRIMRSAPAIGAAAGQSVAVTDGAIPDWFETVQYSYAVGKQSETTGYIDKKKTLWGAGMVFKKALYNRVYLNSPSFLTGPKANTLARGEDVEFCMRLRILGYDLYYDEDLFFKHYMPQERLTSAYRQRFFEGSDYEKRILGLCGLQLSISNLSTLNSAILLSASILRYILIKSSFKSRWSSKHESEVIYLLTGINLEAVPEDIKQIRKLYLDLSSDKKKQMFNIIYT